MFDNIIILDPCYNDLIDHSLYLKAYQRIFKKLKIKPDKVWFMTNKNIGTAYNFHNLLHLKDYDVLYEFPVFDFTKSLFIVVWRRNEWLPEMYRNIALAFHVGRQNYNSDVLSIYPGDYGNKDNKYGSNRFAYVQNLGLVPSKTYEKQFVKIYNDICGLLHIKDS